MTNWVRSTYGNVRVTTATEDRLTILIECRDSFDWDDAYDVELHWLRCPGTVLWYFMGERGLGGGPCDAGEAQYSALVYQALKDHIYSLSEENVSE